MARAVGRDLKKESFWREMVRGQLGSGMSVRTLCRRHALNEPTFYWWRRRLPGRGGENAAAAFVSVRVADDAIVGGAVVTDGAAAAAGRPITRWTAATPTIRSAIEKPTPRARARRCIIARTT